MKLTQEQIDEQFKKIEKKVDEYVAYAGPVRLLNWMDNSSHGFKITLGLHSRGELDSFDNTMKRRKRRGGQRYHVILEGDIPIQMEAMFCGRGWAESKGAHIALHIPGIDDQRYFRGMNTEDQEGDCSTWNILLLEVDENEIIINQKKRDKAYSVPVGGPRSKAVAMLLHDSDFGMWLANHSLHKGRCTSWDFNSIDNLVKGCIGIKSKIELDNGNAQAWTLWEAQFHRPFIQWLNRGNR